MVEERGSMMDRFKSKTLRTGRFRAERARLGSREGLAGLAKSQINGSSIRRPSMQKQITTGFAAVLLLLFGMVAMPAASSARVAIGISVSFGPPVLPVYVQPPCPGPGYIWTPGYWGYAPEAGYYWVPGTWVRAPFVGALWTPGYWGFTGGLYIWHPGYWGTRVGFYGGINYGFGYTGYGYHGGYWRHGRFFYNRAVNRIEGREFSHVYYRREDSHFRRGHVSYYGGPHGINVRPTREQKDAVRFRRFGPVGHQVRQEQLARRNHVQRKSFEHGRVNRGPGQEYRGGQQGPHGRGGHEWGGHAKHQEKGNGHGNEHRRGGRR